MIKIAIAFIFLFFASQCFGVIPRQFEDHFDDASIGAEWDAYSAGVCEECGYCPASTLRMDPLHTVERWIYGNTYIWPPLEVAIRTGGNFVLSSGGHARSGIKLWETAAGNYYRLFWRYGWGPARRIQVYRNAVQLIDKDVLAEAGTLGADYDKYVYLRIRNNKHSVSFAYSFEDYLDISSSEAYWTELIADTNYRTFQRFQINTYAATFIGGSSCTDIAWVRSGKGKGVIFSR